MKKRTLTGALLLVFLASCTAPPLVPKGTVNFWSNRPDPELVQWAATIPGLTLKESSRESSWLPQLQTPDTAPDLMFVDLAHDVVSAGEKKLLADLGPYRGRLASTAKLWPGLTRLLEAERHSSFLPTTVYFWRLFYNTDVLKAAGLAVPRSLPELEAAFEALKKNGVVPLALGSSFGWPALAWVSALDLQHNGVDSHRDLQAARRHFDHPSLNVVYETLARWRDQGWIDPQGGQENWPEAVAKLASGQAGFSFQPASVMGRFRGNAAIESIPVPGVPGRTETAQLAGVQGFVVRAQSPSVEAALALADAYLLAGVPGQVVDLFRVPAVKTALDPATAGLKAAESELLTQGATVVLQLDRVLSPQLAYDANQLLIEFFAKGSTVKAATLATQLAAAAGRDQ